MKQLTKEESAEILLKLLGVFKNDDLQRLDRYLKSKSFCFKSKFISFGNDGHPLPFLFWDGRATRDQFESMIELLPSILDSDGKVYSLAKYDFFEKFSGYLANNLVARFYAAGSWSALSGLEHRVLSMRHGDLPGIARQNIGFGDIYFFPKDFAWILAFNHHNKGFLAGSREFIEGFTDFYPGYRKFVDYHEHDCYNC